MTRRFLAVLLLASLGAFAQANKGGIPSLSAFGPGGALEPTFMGSPLPERFYSTHRLASLTDGKNFVTGMALDFDFTPGAELKAVAIPELTLVNMTDMTNSVVIALSKSDGNQFKNFLVQMAPGDFETIRLDAAFGFDQLHLISSLEFEAYLAQNDDDGFRERAMDVAAPSANHARAAKTTNYCGTNWFTKSMWVEGGTGSPWTVHFKKFETNSVLGYYGIEVYYPTQSAGDLFHDNILASSTYSNCKLYGSYTEQVATNKRLHWLHEDAATALKDLDDALFHGETGRATCTANCGGNFETYLFQ